VHGECLFANISKGPIFARRLYIYIYIYISEIECGGCENGDRGRVRDRGRGREAYTYAETLRFVAVERAPHFFSWLTAARQFRAPAGSPHQNLHRESMAAGICQRNVSGRNGISMASSRMQLQRPRSRPRRHPRSSCSQRNVSGRNPIYSFVIYAASSGLGRDRDGIHCSLHARRGRRTGSLQPTSTTTTTTTMTAAAAALPASSEAIASSYALYSER
jgi:hypothetical protein